MTPITLVMPWFALCPDNAKYGVMRGRALLTKRYRAAKASCATIALAQMRSARKRAFPSDCALSLSVTLYPPDRRRRDLTNVAKGLHDALEGVCYADDAQLDEVTYRRGLVDRENARAEITLSPLPETPEP